jgi:hypothetical protein
MLLIALVQCLTDSRCTLPRMIQCNVQHFCMLTSLRTICAVLYCCFQQVVSILGDGDCFYASVRAAIASKLADSAPLVKTMREWVADTINSGHLSFYQMQAVAHPNEQWLQFVRQPTAPTADTVDTAVVAVDASKPRKKRRKTGSASDDSTTDGIEQQTTATAVVAAESTVSTTSDDSAIDSAEQATATAVAAAAKSTRSSTKLAESLSSAAAESTAVVKVDRRRRSARSSVPAAVNTAAADITTTATTVTTTATGTAEHMVDIVQATAAVPVNDSMQLKASAVTDVKLTADTPASRNKQLAVSMSEQCDSHANSNTVAGATTPPTAKMAVAAAAGEAFAIADSSTAAALVVVASSTDAIDVTASSEKPVTPMTLSASAPPSTSRKRKCTVNSDGSAKKYSEDTTDIVDALGAVIGHASTTAMIPGEADDNVSTGPLVTTVAELKDYIKR